MKIAKWISNNILLCFVLFLLAFIPLYPKLPLLDVKNTWVYVRVEDFLVALTLIVWFVQFVRKKAYIKSPLTIPIVLYWLIGLLSLVHAFFFIFPHLANIFPNVALLFYLRKIEYMSLFIVAFSAIKTRKQLHAVVLVLALTLVAVVVYGFGQKGYVVGWEHRFPAFSTMNEEFAKGIPLQISALGRVSATFAGHYDLAAYLVLLIGILSSLIFGYKKIWIKILLFTSSLGGLLLLMLTASRTSFAVYLLTIVFMLIIQKQKKFIIPVVLLSIILLQAFSGLSSRFASTLSQVDVVVDARTGQAIGIAKNTNGKLTVEDKDLTGEDLPQGSGFINLSGEGKSADSLTYKRTRLRGGESSTEVTNYDGQFVVKKAYAYDVSFTTRFQGEWPRAMEAFRRNIFLGSGYSSINLATDNNYLRILGETGFLGFASFGLIFVVFILYARRILEHMEQSPHRSFVLGAIAGIFGLGMNAILIDVFEASKVAFVMWMVIGLAMAVLRLFEKEKVHLTKELKNFFLSTPAIIIYLAGVTSAVFGMIINTYFVGDDFTWLRWAAECKRAVGAPPGLCMGLKEKLVHYFISSDGFFYRPGTKTYFQFMHAIFSLNQGAYHVFSIVLHAAAVGCIYLLTHNLLKSKLVAFLSALLFLVLSVHFESVFWISVTGHLVASVAILLSLVLYTAWRNTHKLVYVVLAWVFAATAPFFHEFGIVAPLVLITYDLVIKPSAIRTVLRKSWWIYLIFLIQIPGYLIIRYLSQSFWQGGDYSYNVAKLPFNALGNLVGYVGITLASTSFMPIYTTMRQNLRENMLFALIGVVVITLFVLFVALSFKKLRKLPQIGVALFGVLFFVITLLPFLGLGNITYRYAYLPSVGIVILAGWLLKLFYTSVKDKRFAAALMIIVVGIYSLYQVQVLQHLNKDWIKAGTITSNMLNDVDLYFYQQTFEDRRLEFYIADVPIKTGEAWVFPVGLKDALWFPFQHETFKVKQVSTVEEALKLSEATTSARAFQFDRDGNLNIIKAQP